MSTDNTPTVPLHIKFANSDIPDQVILQLADAVDEWLNGNPRHRRHSKDAINKLYTALNATCHARAINIEAGVKVVQQTINLLV